MAAAYHRRQYKEVAAILADRLQTTKRIYGHKPEWCAAETSAVLSLVDDFADLFAADNGLFDRSRFERAANPNGYER